eukprot:tig00000237_g20492.t1
MDAHYKLSAELLPKHEMDVRSVCALLNGQVATASRDRTVKVWAVVPDAEGKERAWTEVAVLTGHEHFVSCVAEVPRPDGGPTTLVSGSHDKTAIVWEGDRIAHVLTGHENTVCSISAASTGVIVTGSWDNTARVWVNGQCKHVLRGHEAAVWAVLALPDGDVITGSADRTIRHWRDGKQVHLFRGHEDVVRSIAAVPGLGFVSCANDGTVRLWAMSGDLLQTIPAHDSFVYQVAVLANGQYATASEDKSVKIWRRDGECVQTIAHPGVVWSVALRGNGDLLTGSSDGVARVWTREAARAAGEEALAQYDAQLASQTVSKKMIGDIDLAKLPGLDALATPGRTDGETKIVRSGEGAEVHKWSNAEGRWVKIGDVVEGAGEGRKSYLGKEYDFVFDVDLGDGVMRKLPYNAGENPYAAAQKFISDNEISQDFLEQIARWIEQQAGPVTLGQGTPGAGNVDPYTGNQRESVPGPPPRMGRAADPGRRNFDPYTGNQRESDGPAFPAPAPRSSPPAPAGAARGPSPMEVTPTAGPAVEPSPYRHFPRTAYLPFDTANFAGISKKLAEFNGALAADAASAGQAMDAKEQAALQRVVETLQRTQFYHATSFQPSDYYLASKLLRWPADKLFPVLDLFRMWIVHPAAAQAFATEPTLQPALQIAIQAALTNAPGPNRLLALRALNNLFACGAMRRRALAPDGPTAISGVLDELADLQRSDNANLRNAYATLLVNYAVGLREQGAAPEATAQVLSSLSELVQADADEEVLYRSLVALGTLVYRNPAAAQLASDLGLPDALAARAPALAAPRLAEALAEIRKELKL